MDAASDPSPVVGLLIEHFDARVPPIPIDLCVVQPADQFVIAPRHDQVPDPRNAKVPSTIHTSRLPIPNPPELIRSRQHRFGRQGLEGVIRRHLAASSPRMNGTLDDPSRRVNSW